MVPPPLALATPTQNPSNPAASFPVQSPKYSCAPGMPTQNCTVGIAQPDLRRPQSSTANSTCLRALPHDLVQACKLDYMQPPTKHCGRAPTPSTLLQNTGRCATKCCAATYLLLASGNATDSVVAALASSNGTSALQLRRHTFPPTPMHSYRAQPCPATASPASLCCRPDTT